MELKDLHPIVCAGCGLVDRGRGKDEPMVCITHPGRGIVWCAHRDCAFREFRVARRLLLPVIGQMRGYDRRTWEGYRERLFLDTRRRPALFTETVQDIFERLITQPMDSVCTALDVPHETYGAWVDTVVAVLRRFCLEPRPPVEVDGPKLRLIATA